MRRIALVGLLAGCNQIYGLDSTRAIDAAEPDALPRITRLTYLVGPAMFGGAPGPTSLPPITPAPAVRVAELDKSFADATYLADGLLLYPRDFTDGPWRVEYTPAGEVPHEVQWQPANGSGHLVIPIFGSPARTRVPPGTSLRVSMTAFGSPHTWVNPVVRTSGYWTEAASSGSTQTPVLDLHATAPLSGDYGAPDPVAGDIVFALQYGTQQGCVLTTHAGSAMVPALEPGAEKTVGLAHDTGFSAIAFHYPVDNVPGSAFDVTEARLADALGGTAAGTRAGDGLGSRAIYARIAHPEMPAFTEMYSDVPAPLMVALADCPASSTSTPPAADAGNLLAFPRVAYTFASNDRLVGAVRLRSSIAAIGTLNTGSGNYDVRFPVQLAITPKLGTLDLGAGPDGQAIGDAPLDLTFDFEKLDFETDYFEVVLYKLGAQLEPVRVYVGPSPATPTIRFDPSVMMQSAEYVFAIRTYVGRPEARRYDFAPVASPQAVGTIFTRTFKR